MSVRFNVGVVQPGFAQKISEQFNVRPLVAKVLAARFCEKDGQNLNIEDCFAEIQQFLECNIEDD